MSVDADDTITSPSITISPFEMFVKNKNNKTRNSIGINEVSILRQSRQAASLSISHGSKQVIKRLVSDGVLVSTPAGSTAYNLSVHGPILSLNSKKISIAPISAFRPRRWKGKIVNDKSKIYLKGGLGHIAKIRLFESDFNQNSILLDSIRDNNWLVNEANLIFYVDQDEILNWNDCLLYTSDAADE